MVGDGDGIDTTVKRPPSRAVIEAVASVEGVPPDEVGPPEYESLYEVLEPEALDSLFADQPDGTPRPGGFVSFTYCGYRITVEKCGTVTIEGTVDD
ncbi:HalOD1 output domain-containing protein [Halosolutus halophilus]|uniref:HalOD1 output domain-containing protein n=1 Tax=Halosolutus halophilus TaxID=1552990 RepID=UPI0022350B28|nr:HalOD1 output domain-containing protein [Halosolutus halophilus]